MKKLLIAFLLFLFTVSFAFAENIAIRIAYDGSGNAEYIGEAEAGTAVDGNRVWRIKKIAYDGSNNPTSVKWAEGSTSYRFEWDERASYDYK